MVTSAEFDTFRHFSAGASQCETATMLGVSQATVSRRLSRLRRRFPGFDVTMTVCREIARCRRGSPGG